NRVIEVLKQNLALVIAFIVMSVVHVFLVLYFYTFGFVLSIDLTDIVFIVLINFAMVIIYLEPSMVAYFRCKQNKGAILALNILLGFTFIGWVIALVWALTQDVSLGQGTEAK